MTSWHPLQLALKSPGPESPESYKAITKRNNVDLLATIEKAQLSDDSLIKYPPLACSGNQNRTSNWTDEETSTLLDILADPSIKPSLEPDASGFVSRNRHIYEQVADRMKLMGYDRPFESIKFRVQNLKASYRKALNGQRGNCSSHALMRVWDKLVRLWGDGQGRSVTGYPQSPQLMVTPPPSSAPFGTKGTGLPNGDTPTAGLDGLLALSGDSSNASNSPNPEAEAKATPTPPRPQGSPAPVPPPNSSMEQSDSYYFNINIDADDTDEMELKQEPMDSYEQQPMSSENETRVDDEQPIEFAAAITAEVDESTIEEVQGLNGIITEDSNGSSEHGPEPDGASAQTSNGGGPIRSRELRRGTGFNFEQGYHGSRINPLKPHTALTANHYPALVPKPTTTSPITGSPLPPGSVPVVIPPHGSLPVAHALNNFLRNAIEGDKPPTAPPGTAPGPSAEEMSRFMLTYESKQDELLAWEREKERARRELMLQIHREQMDREDQRRESDREHQGQFMAEMQAALLAALAGKADHQ